MSGELSLAAVLSTQVMGSSALSGSEDRMRELFEQDLAVMRSISFRNEGQVFGIDETQVQMVFDNPFQEVASALELQGLLSRSSREGSEKLTYRFGIHHGEVELAHVGVEGEAAAIASRIQQIARSGGIWASRQVVDAVKGRIPFIAVPVGSRTFKDVGKTIDLYELVQGLGPIKKAGKRWRLSRMAQGWASSMAVHADGPSPKERGAIGWGRNRAGHRR